jgi:hypothetical protein
MSACLGGNIPFLMAGDVKHVDWNSRLIMTMDRFLRDLTKENSCLIDGPDIRTPIPYNSFATPDALDIVITKDIVTPDYLTTCSAPRSNHITVPIDTLCRSSISNPPECPDLRRTERYKFQVSLEFGLSFNPDLSNELPIDARVKKISSTVSKVSSQSDPKYCPRDEPQPPIQAVIFNTMRLKNQLRKQWQISRDPAPKAEFNHLKSSVTHQLNLWRKDQGNSALESHDPEDH